MTLTRKSDAWQVDVPEGKSGDVEIRQFTIGGESLANFFESLRGRNTQPGTYTGLYRNGSVWMTDTDAERRDHYEAMGYHGRILIHGLGLGCIVNYILTNDPDATIDVVELDPDVIALVGEHYATKFPGRFTVHQGDAHTFVWPKGTKFDHIWSDIWEHLCVDNLADMARLRRRYSRLCPAADHGCWSRDRLIAERRRDRNAWWNQ